MAELHLHPDWIADQFRYKEMGGVSDSPHAAVLVTMLVAGTARRGSVGKVDERGVDVHQHGCWSMWSGRSGRSFGP